MSLVVFFAFSEFQASPGKLTKQVYNNLKNKFCSLEVQQKHALFFKLTVLFSPGMVIFCFHLKYSVLSPYFHVTWIFLFCKISINTRLLA